MFFLAAALTVCAAAAIYDLRTARIPNALTMWPLPFAIVSHAVRGYWIGGAHGALLMLGSAIGGAVLCALVPWAMWRAGAAGGGDVKLLALAGALCLPTIGLEGETYAFVIAAALASMHLAWRGELLRVFRSAFRVATNSLRAPSRRVALAPTEKTWFRFGPAIFAGMAIATLLNAQ